MTSNTFTGLAASPAIEKAGDLQRVAQQSLGTAEATTTNPTKSSPVAFDMNEQAIALGTVTLPADEAAPRLGFAGKRGLERFRGLCKAGKIPAFYDGKSYRLHWPSVTKALFGGGK